MNTNEPRTCVECDRGPIRHVDGLSSIVYDEKTKSWYHPACQTNR